MTYWPGSSSGLNHGWSLFRPYAGITAYKVEDSFSDCNSKQEGRKKEVRNDADDDAPPTLFAYRLEPHVCCGAGGGRSSTSSSPFATDVAEDGGKAGRREREESAQEKTERGYRSK